MAFSDFELKKFNKALRAFIERRRPPARMRDQLDFGYRIEGQSVLFFEIRPRRASSGVEPSSQILAIHK